MLKGSSKERKKGEHEHVNDRWQRGRSRGTETERFHLAGNLVRLLLPDGTRWSPSPTPQPAFSAASSEFERHRESEQTTACVCVCV